MQESENEEPIYSLQEYLSRLANSRNRLYDSYYGSNYMVPDMLRDRRRSRAENNFQLRVRKRATPMAESNFQLVSQLVLYSALCKRPKNHSSKLVNVILAIDCKLRKFSCRAIYQILTSMHI